MPVDPRITLADRYALDQTRVFLSGTQALVRLLLIQRARDTAAGLDTRGFISGYRGSPLGGLDKALWAEQARLDEAGLTFRPAVNEELAATAIAGTQQVPLFPGARHQGVFGVWYGKGPGVDRSGDAFKHGNNAGSSPLGGVLLLAGDDHAARSSTAAHQSEVAFMDALVPVLHPADVADLITVGLFGLALSRFSGCWVGMKTIAETVESTATIPLSPPLGPAFRLPDPADLPAGDRHIRWPDPPQEQERRLITVKLPAALAFARANAIDRVTIDPGPGAARLMVAAVGKAYLDCRQALTRLGLDEAAARALGLRLYKIGMPWPLEPIGLQDAARGVETLLVIEEKRAVVEPQILAHLYPLAIDDPAGRGTGTGAGTGAGAGWGEDPASPTARRRAPRVVGKRDARGRPLLPEAGELTPDGVADALARCLVALSPPPANLPQALRLRAARAEASAGAIPTPPRVGGAGPTAPDPAPASAPHATPQAGPGTAPAPDSADLPARKPTFCAGCPHNVSTRVPEGSRALAGIGCHFMVTWMPERRTATFSQMGAEGAAWIGQAPFCAETHVFANLGDGTYFHSGILAIRAAVAAGVSITYKLLYNDAVAMTGGQPVDGSLSVAAITRQLEAEGVAGIVVVTEDPGRYPPGSRLAPGTRVRPRRAFAAVQDELRRTPGVTVLIYDQTCAAEKRRRRKRGRLPPPPRRVVINDLVCDGCGDCGMVSSCVALVPVDTPLGRKRAVDPAVCNGDETCLDGLCPSFVTLPAPTEAEAEARIDASAAFPAAAIAAAGLETPPDPWPNPTATPLDAPPLDAPPLDAPWSALITGIGGTGVVTIGALLGMAAHLEGKAATVLDQTGIAQKNGAVTSHVRIARTPERIAARRIDRGEATLILAFDALTAAGPTVLATMDAGRTRAVVNTTPVMTLDFARDPDAPWPDAAIRAHLTRASREAWFVDAGTLAWRLTGNGLAVNPFLLGHAWQRGLIPLSQEALLRAIALNGVAVAANQEAFLWGRRHAWNPTAVEALAATRAGRDPLAGSDPTPPPSDLSALIDQRADLLAAYQGPRLAARYRATLARVRAAEAAACGPDTTALTEAVARSLAAVWATKDPYEVARLMTDGRFAAALRRQGMDPARATVHLAPPGLARPDPRTGRPRKWALGPWVWPLLRGLARLKSLRGTPLDPFARTAEGRVTRELIHDQAATLDLLLARLTPETHALAVEIATLPQAVRGYGHVRAEAARQAHERKATLLARLPD